MFRVFFKQISADSGFHDFKHKHTFFFEKLDYPRHLTHSISLHKKLIEKNPRRFHNITLETAWKVTCENHKTIPDFPSNR